MIKSKIKLRLIDSLEKKSQDKLTSIWAGRKSTYVFKRTGEDKPKKPVTQVYQNRQYLTGLFRTKIKDEYSGDIKQSGGKKYLVFKVVNDNKIHVFEKVY